MTPLPTSRRLPRRALPLLLLALLIAPTRPTGVAERHLLYVASPGTRNYLEYGGVGILVFDIDRGYEFVRRIPTWSAPEGKPAENVKGIVASAATGRVYVTSLTHVIAIDAVSGETIWNRAYDGGADRLAISPDGRTLYVPQLEGPAWHVVDAATGDVVATIETKSGSHNTIYSADGERVYLAGLKSAVLTVVDPHKRAVIGAVGPFGNVVRPFTVNGSNTLVYANVNDLLGFEVGDVRTGKVLHRVEVTGYAKGPVKRHGCPSHGIALTPDEKELWIGDCANGYIHVFDVTAAQPKQVASLKMRDCVGWVSFSMDGRVAYSSTGEMIDVATRKVIATLRDETGRDVQSEKMLDLVIADGKVVRAGNQFGVGAKGH
ncbi:MAG: PQQ-dependent catabolism-associated beta-propeller protein [Gemmatimonadetes bacterium]|nr:PQQ-dependent catabolism-associated beta-propeller protein [Gemmatimonadota bacterium]